MAGVVSQFRSGTLSRREFIRLSTLLGISGVAAARLGGFIWPRPAVAASPLRGGILNIAGRLPVISDPVRLSSISGSNVLRQVAEYLTFCGADNIAQPYLLDHWEVSEDLTTWTLHLRQGITWNNGDTFVADDVVFSLRHWLDKDARSELNALLGAYLDGTGLEKVNDHQVRLHLKRPEIALPEHLAHCQALVLNAKTFEGDFLKAPVGTGPFTLAYYRQGEAALLKARGDYWQRGADEKPLPYLSEINCLDLGGDPAVHFKALRDGAVQLVDEGLPPVSNLQGLPLIKDNPGILVSEVGTAATRALCMRTDIKPFDDFRVRRALKLCQDREKILALVLKNAGIQGQDTQVSPVHPDYCPVPTPAYQPRLAKHLLAEAGYPHGLKVELVLPAEHPEIVRYGEVLKQDAKASGFEIAINALDANQYVQQQINAALGILPLPHQPLGIMGLTSALAAPAQAPKAPADGTRWMDEEYSALLARAGGLLDVAERRQVICRLEKIQQERGNLGVAFFINSRVCLSKQLKGVPAHPNGIIQLHQAWLDV